MTPSNGLGDFASFTADDPLDAGGPSIPSVDRNVRHSPSPFGRALTGPYKRSMFNVRVGDGILFNTLTGALLRLTEAQRAVYDRVDEHDRSTAGESLSRLYEGGFIVEAGVRESKTLKAMWYEAVNADKPPMLTIAPTMNCNFGCDYCFETHARGQMSPAVRAALIELIETELAAAGPTRLEVTWFGGEPLMGLPVILDLSDRFDGLVEKGVLTGWEATMITNGLLATPKTMAKLENRNIASLQVTIDGPRELHDQRRILKRGGKPTFDIICANLRALPGIFALTIRVNVDRRNRDELERLADQLKAEGVLDRPRTSIYLAIVENYGGADGVDGGDFLSTREFASTQRSFEAYCARMGYPLATDRPRPSIGGVCQVDNVNAFVVDPDGTLMKCWAELRNKPEVAAHLLDRSTWPEPRITRLEQRDPFDDDECMACRLLPSCMGSCPKTRDLLRTIGVKMCPPLKHNLEPSIAAMAAEMQPQPGELHFASRPTLIKEPS